MSRWRYLSLSNSTIRASRFSFSLDGITGVISISVNISSIQFARYPLSPANAIDPVTRLPWLSTNSESVPVRRSIKEVFSWTCPAVISNCSGKPLASQKSDGFLWKNRLDISQERDPPVLWGRFFPPPLAHLAALTIEPSIHQGSASSSSRQFGTAKRNDAILMLRQTWRATPLILEELKLRLRRIN